MNETGVWLCRGGEGIGVITTRGDDRPRFFGGPGSGMSGPGVERKKRNKESIHEREREIRAEENERAKKG